MIILDDTFDDIQLVCHIFLDFASKVIWNKPLDWSGPEAAFYHSFDTPDGLVSWEGTNQTCNVPLVSGKVMMNIFTTDEQTLLSTFNMIF